MLQTYQCLFRFLTNLSGDTQIFHIINNIFQHNNFMFQSVPAYSIPKEKLNKKKIQDTPASSKYNINADIIKKKFPAWKIGTSHRIQFKKQISPGPSDYNIKKEFVLSSSPHYVMGEKFESKQCLMTPGPATYDPLTNFVAKKIQSITFSKQKRTKKTKQSVPGPGTYQYKTSLTNRSVLFDRKKRFNSQQKLNLNHILDINPDKEAVLTKSPAFVFPHQKREHQIKNISPGPLDYKVKRSLTQTGSPKAIIGKQKRSRKQFNINLPGPADYEVSTTLNQTHISYSIGRSPRSTSKQYNKTSGPGPTTYYPKAQKFEKIKQKNKYNKSTHDLNIPWVYCTFNKTGGRFEKDKRFKEVKLDSPGPSTYNIPTTVANVSSYERMH